MKWWKKTFLEVIALTILWGAGEYYTRICHHRPLIAHTLAALPFPSTFLGPPKGHIFASDYAKKHPERYLALSPPKQTLLAQFPLANSNAPIEFPEVFVLKIPQGRVFGREGLVISKEDQVIANASAIWGPIEQNPIFSHWKLPPVTKVDGKVAVIASSGGECNYFHWMFDVLPRLEILKRSGIAFDKIYLAPLKKQYHKQTFSLFAKHFDIPEDKIVWAEKKTLLQAEELIVPSLPGHSGIVSKSTANLLRDIILPHAFPKSTPKKIYISRKNAVVRRIINEEELITALKPLGFEMVVLENLSVANQALVFAQAEIIVAPHGAGLTNLVFCKEGTQIVEIFPPNYTPPCFWNISAQLGLHHFCIKGSEVGKDLSVDLKGVISILHMDQDHTATE